MSDAQTPLGDARPSPPPAHMMVCVPPPAPRSDASRRRRLKLVQNPPGPQTAVVARAPVLTAQATSPAPPLAVPQPEMERHARVTAAPTAPGPQTEPANGNRMPLEPAAVTPPMLERVEEMVLVEDSPTREDHAVAAPHGNSNGFARDPGASGVVVGAPPPSQAAEQEAAGHSGMPDEPHGITQPVQAAPEPTPPPPPPVEERADPPLEQAADGEGQDSQTLIDDAQMSLWGDQPAQDGQEEAQSAVEGAPTLWDETSIPDEGGQGTAAVAGAPPPTEVDEMIQAAAGVQVAAPKDETPPTATWPVGTADDAEDAAPAPVGYEERYTGQSDGATEETVETAPEETEPPLEPAPLDSVPPVTPVFDDTVRPGQRAGVRPPEQNRDFTTDGHEGEVQPVAPVPLRDAGARRKPTLEQAEKRMDELLAKAVDIEGTVAVMSPAGGVGKSTMSLAIADTLAKAGVGPIAIVDCDPEYNGLALLGVGQLNKLYTEAPARPEGYAIHLPSGAHLYAMPMEPELQRFFAENPATLRHTATLLRDTYKVVILDAGAGVNNPIGRELGATCNEAVLVSRASFSTSAGMLAAYGYLRNARGMVDPGGEATRTTVTTVINNIRDYHRPYLGIIQEEYFAAYIQPLLVPSSEAIEFGLEAGTFNQADMPVAVRVALKRVAATVAAGLRRT